MHNVQPLKGYTNHVDWLPMMEANQSDESLMLQYAQGDPDAFESLYHRHKGPLFRFILRQCNDEAITNELFQDIWQKIISHSENYTDTAKFTTWLYTIARNRVIDWFRTQSNATQFDQIETDAEEHEKHDDQPITPLTQLERKRLAKQIQIAVAELPSDQREVFLLFQETDMTLAEIADVTGITTEAAKSRYRYAIQKLRQRLRAENE